MKDFNRKAILDANNARRKPKPRSDGISREIHSDEYDEDYEDSWDHLYDDLIYSEREERFKRAERKIDKTFEK
jgi:hypothetical protein